MNHLFRNFAHCLSKRTAIIPYIPRFSNIFGRIPIDGEIEVSPISWSIVETIVRKMQPYGAFLMIDYGSNSLSSESLRAIRNHKFVGIFDSPGDCDLSCDVDFEALKSLISVGGKNC